MAGTPPAHREAPLLPRILEPEAMDAAEEARDYDAMDHGAVNRAFVDDFLGTWNAAGTFLDVGTGTAQIPIEFCRRSPARRVVAVDLAEEMLAVARRNVAAAGMEGRIRLERANARCLPYPDGSFAAVTSNSIVHHVPEPRAAFAEMVRACAVGGRLFFRDLLRPPDEAELLHLVDAHAGDANGRQRKMFADSLHAALTLDEVRAIVVALGFPPESVRQTSDRHWTWSAAKPPATPSSRPCSD